MANCMRKIFWLLALLLFGFSPLFSQQKAWTQKADFFEKREGAVSFVINNKLYVGTGDEKADWWQYDPSTNVWIQKASLPAPGRSFATGFSIGNKGYIATGSKVKRIPLGNNTYVLDSLMKDVWEYDPVTDNWTRKADFGGLGRARAVAFVLNNKAYMGSGEIFGANYPIMGNGPANRAAKDFGVFDPVANTWTQLADIPFRRINAIAFTGNGKGFIGTGFYNTYRTIPQYDTDPGHIIEGGNLQDLWAYDTAANAWSKKSDFPGGKRMGLSVFEIGDTLYTIAGAETANNQWPSDTDMIKRDVWAYNTVTDTWVQKPNFPGTARRYAIAGTVAGKGYVGTGGVADLWEYTPTGALIPLPVTLVSFDGTLQGGKAKLEWTVENEQTLDQYEIERSGNGAAFSKAGEVKATGKKQYSFDDNSSTQRTSYYRLKMVDKDGSFRYSQMRRLINNEGGIASSSFYPSPLNGTTGYLAVVSATTQKLRVLLTDIAGHELRTQVVSVVAGSNNLPLTFDKLAKGTYLLKVIDAEKHLHVIRFVKD